MYTNIEDENELNRKNLNSVDVVRISFSIAKHIEFWLFELIHI